MAGREVRQANRLVHAGISLGVAAAMLCGLVFTLNVASMLISIRAVAGSPNSAAAESPEQATSRAALALKVTTAAVAVTVPTAVLAMALIVVGLLRRERSGPRLEPAKPCPVVATPVAPQSPPPAPASI